MAIWQLCNRPGTQSRHVAGTFFTDGPVVSQIRLYKDGKIVANFNVGGETFHLENSAINSRTLNQPVDLNFPIGNDPGEYDLQLIRSKSSGVATGIAAFWGYITTDSCQLR